MSFWDKVKKYAATTWKVLKVFAGQRTVVWLANTFLIPAIIAYADSKGYTIPADVLKEIVGQVTGLIYGGSVDTTTALTVLGGSIAATGTMLANDKYADFQKRLYEAKYGDMADVKLEERAARKMNFLEMKRKAEEHAKMIRREKAHRRVDERFGGS